MSVINQMLKDLDQRQNQSREHQSALHNPVVITRSSKKQIISIIAVVIVLNALGLYVWQLYQENQQLKISHQQDKIDKPTKLRANELTTLNAELADTVEVVEKNESNLQNSPLAMAEEQVRADDSTPVLNAVTEQQEPKATKIEAQLNATEQNNGQSNVAVSSLSNQNQTIEKATQASQPQSLENSAASRPSLSISRKNLSPAQLAAQKYQQAEQAINKHQAERAERLLEEVLLLVPEHVAARKQLAALWFGRQAYQPAINVLSQGIALLPQQSEFRLMRARIYLKQGLAAQALDSVLPLSAIADVEYQTVIATTALQVKRYDAAINSYQRLIELQPAQGRWYLGLATAYDSNGQFSQANVQYRQALAQTGLSSSAQQFIRQRLQELGE